MCRHLHGNRTIDDKAVIPFARLPDNLLACPWLHDDVYVAPGGAKRESADGHAVGEHLECDDSRCIGQHIGDCYFAVGTLCGNLNIRDGRIGGKRRCRKEKNRHQIEKRFHVSRSFLIERH